jgi:hypothetical protein
VRHAVAIAHDVEADENGGEERQRHWQCEVAKF